MARDIVLTIDMDENGSPKVTWPPADDCTDKKGRKACCYQRHHVRWKLDASLGERAWAVLFTGGSPFKGDQAVFCPGSDRAKVKRSVTGEFKYWVTLADEDGDLKVKDPRIMVREEPIDDQDRLMSMAADLEEFAEDAEVLVASALELAEDLRELAVPQAQAIEPD